MPTLITPLVNGFSDAPSGTVEFYQMGTATPSTAVYSDSLGATPVAHPHTLNSAGRIVRYVTERVDVVVKNVSGATVASFTPNVDARTVNVANAMFNGGSLTTLNAGLTLLNTSFGTDDGFILPADQQDSTEYLLKNLLAHTARDNRSVSTPLGATTTYTPDSDYGVHFVSITGASLAFANPTGSASPRAGAPLIIFFLNSAGANRTPTWGTAYSGVPATAVVSGNTAAYVFVYTGTLASPGAEWIAVTTSPVVAAS
jgi:hypothetical protein